MLSLRNKRESFTLINNPLVFLILIIITIFSFMSFNPTPFIISFTGYFLMLHLTEAYVLKSFINNS